MVIVLYHEVIQGERVQGTMFPAGAWGLESRARCAGFSVMEIGNRKERLRDYASFPDQSPKRIPFDEKRSFRAECKAFCN